MSYKTNIIIDTQENDTFRRVLFTGDHSQLAVLSIPPGQEIGMDEPADAEQAIFVSSGNGTAMVDGEESIISPGDVIVITPGSMYDLMNTGEEPLKLYMLATPPELQNDESYRSRSPLSSNVDDDREAEEELIDESDIRGRS